MNNQIMLATCILLLFVADAFADKCLTHSGNLTTLNEYLNCTGEIRFCCGDVEKYCCNKTEVTMMLINKPTNRTRIVVSDGTTFDIVQPSAVDTDSDDHHPSKTVISGTSVFKRTWFIVTAVFRGLLVLFGSCYFLVQRRVSPSDNLRHPILQLPPVTTQQA